MADILIKNVRLISGGYGKTYESANIVVEGRRIVEASEKSVSGFSADHVIDGRGKIALPGFVNAHIHTEETLGMNSVPDTIRHIPWFEKWALPYYNALTEEDRYWSSLLSQLLMLRSGMTCYSDSANRSPDLAARAAEKSGIRAFVAKWICDIGRYLSSPFDECLNETESLLKKYSSQKGRIRAIASVIGLNQCSNELYLAVKELAEKYDVVITSHEASGHEDVMRSIKRTGRRPVENLSKIGFLSPRTLLSHLTDVTSKEVELVRKSKTKVVMCPTAELKKGKGLSHYGKLTEMLQGNITVCVGTDTANSSNHLDVLRSANLLLLLAKDYSQDPAVLDARRAIKMITEDAAACLGLKNCGTIKKGCIADITIFEPSALESFTRADPVQTIVYGSTPRTFATIVDGEIVYHEGMFTRVKQEEVISQCKRRAERILARLPRKGAKKAAG